MTHISDEDLQKLLDEATPGPWAACKDGTCICGQVWSIASDHPVASATSTPWGDEYFEHAPTEDDPSAVVRRFFEYGGFPDSEFHANAALIAITPTIATEVLALRKRVAAADALAEAMTQIDALDPEDMIDGCSQAAIRGLVLRMGEIARAALAAYEASK